MHARPGLCPELHPSVCEFPTPRDLRKDKREERWKGTVLSLNEEDIYKAGHRTVQRVDTCGMNKQIPSLSVHEELILINWLCSLGEKGWNEIRTMEGSDLLRLDSVPFLEGG